jgi:hypothetical protein
LSKLTSESPDSRWVSGRQYLQKESLGIGVNLAYYKNEDNLLIFDAYIENFSIESIEINPTQIELISMDSNKEIISKVKAVDPEEMLTNYDKKEARVKADLANDMTTSLFLATTNLVSTIADEKDSELSEEEKDRRFNQRLYWLNDNQIDMGRQEDYIESIKNTRLYWEQVPIRRTDILPQQYLDGRVFFERNTAAKYYQIVFNLPKESLRFEFEQQILQSYK